MNPAFLLGHFERLVDAPDAIPRLRQFVLDLAVRGKLVEQNASDEPVSKLLERIAAERARQVQAGEIKEPKPTELIDKSERPIEVPERCVWMRLKELGSLGGGMTPSMSRSEFWGGDVAWVSPKDMRADEIVSSELRITEQALKQTRLQVYPPGSLFMVARSGILKRTFPVAINRLPAAANQDMKVLVPFVREQNRYLQIMFRGLTHFILEELVKSGTTVQSLKYAEFEEQPFPLPPLAEQHRIVAKVDELMALCDRLKAARTERESRRDRLVAASLHRLSQPADEDSADAFRANARFYFNHLPRLTTRPDHIKRLRQTILNLAVRGRLVPQDANDEPASKLLQQIAERRSELLNAGYPNASEARTQSKKLSKQKIPADLPVLPLGWTWATLQQCSLLVVDCKNKTALYANSGVKLVRTTNVRGGKLNSIDQKYVTEKIYAIWSARCAPEPGDILITREAPMGEVCAIPADEKICLGQRMMLARLVPETINPGFMLYSLRDPNLMERVQDKPLGMTVQHLRVGGVETLLVPLPPVAEQHRIVAKVDDLMALCDRLEASLAETEADSRRLLEAVLHEALAPVNELTLAAAS